MPNLTNDHIATVKEILSGGGTVERGDPRTAADREFGRTLEGKGFAYTHTTTLDDLRVDHYAKLDDLSFNAMVMEHEDTYFLIERVPDAQH